MRLFFAAWPPPDTARALAAWARPLGGRPIPADKIHLTLAFLGDADPARALAAASSVRGHAHHMPIDTAKYWKHNQIVWVGPRDTPAALQALVYSLHAALQRAGFTLEPRPFAAHVTLVRKAPKPTAIEPLPAVAWPVRDFTLVRSRVSSKGSTYEIVERFPLD